MLLDKSIPRIPANNSISHVPAYIRFGIYSFFRNFENFDFDSAYIRENMVDFDVELDACSIQ